jgi:hypothetical protein
MELQQVTSASFDQQIQKRKDELQLLLMQMEELRLSFVAEVVRFASQWFEETARFYVAKQSQITLTMSKDKIASMKFSVNNLVKTAEKPVSAALSKPEVWWHMVPVKNSQLNMYEQFENRFPEIVDRAVRRALGELGKILEQYGYGVTVNVSNKSEYPEFWFEDSDDPTTPGGPFFPHLLVWSEQMQNIIRQYSEKYKIAIGFVNDVERLKDEEKKQQARKVWDET